MSDLSAPKANSTHVTAPFTAFAPPFSPQSEMRKAITAAYRRPEAECVSALLEQAILPAEEKVKIRDTARKLIAALRAKHKGTGVEGLVHEYSLSSQEGVALMCLAEALLRIPDTATRDALIRDKISDGDWKSHIGGGRSLFVNAATWGLVVTGKLTGTVNDRSLSAALTRLIARCGEPVIRRGVDMAMRMMGEQFVTGETIDEALKRARPLEEKGFRYSYDMLGEAATTHEDAERYYRDYVNAIHAIGKAAQGRGIYDGPGISIKLSALHPRYARAQIERVMAELLPKVKELTLLAKKYDIGLNIDAEEADRLELSLDLLEALCTDPDLNGFDGIGFVVQAYGKRCPFVLDYIIDLARRTNRRIMVRLVKGAYWDAEIKRAQVDGLEEFPVFTRKVYTDISYIACARKLLAATDAVFPQFATHNAQTLATIYHLAGTDFKTGQYEFQCLHGMGEPLYDEVVGAQKLGRPARIYAPVGTHETLLAYLVRRLLENGANSSFVNRIGDKSVSIDSLIEDPADIVSAMTVIGAHHDQIALPKDIYGERKNSSGLDLSNENVLAALSEKLQLSAARNWQAEPQIAIQGIKGTERLILNPGDHRDQVGIVFEVSEETAQAAVEKAAEAAKKWAETSVAERAAILERAADALQAEMPVLLGLIIREAGKSVANAIAEVREAIDFLRYYAEQARKNLGVAHKPLGPVVCISPWNFPLAIFLGQVSAALVAGNSVLAKPAEETPLIAAEAIRLLHEAGIPKDALQFVPGDGRIGAALVGSPAVCGVMFTGSTEVARIIQKQLSQRLLNNMAPIPFIAETGGQNAMIVDSSALAEQVVFDVIASAFDSAGQRCSALRILCLQEEVADRILTMLKGALRELTIGRTDKLSVDIGPVITKEAQDNINAHIEAMRAAGRKIEQLPLGDFAQEGTYVAPTIIELQSIHELKQEIFGPVLHVIRYKRDDIDRLIDDINATGYGLTFGLHTRLDETISHVSSRIRVGNIYINRNVIGAVVGVQPFGGRALSGTGPKAGGPLYLGRLVHPAPALQLYKSGSMDAGLIEFAKWLGQRGMNAMAKAARDAGSVSALGLNIELPGPVGEKNLYSLHPRGKILAVAQTQTGLYRQIIAALATGNDIVIDEASGLKSALIDLPATLKARISWTKDWDHGALPLAGALLEGDAETILSLNQRIAARNGPLLLTQALTTEMLAEGAQGYCLNWLLEEVSTSINTTAAGGNASLMSIG